MYLSAGLRKIMDNAHPQLEEQLQLDPNHTGVKPHEGDHGAPAFGDEAFHRNLAVLTGNGSGILGLDMSNGTSDAEISAPGGFCRARAKCCCLNVLDLNFFGINSNLN